MIAGQQAVASEIARTPLVLAAGGLACALVVADALVPGESLALHGATALAIVSTMALAVRAIGLTAGHRVATMAENAASVADDEALVALRREKDAAVAASAAKSRYLANVSHEIRSPLNAIYGYAQLLERQSGVDPLEAARVIRRSTEHLTDLAEGLLDISLVENGVMRVAHDTVLLAPFLEQVERMFHPAAAAKGLRFRCDLPPHMPEAVRTDQKRLRQVLINLVSNAIKYTEQGEVTLGLHYSGQVAVFEVRDTGPGIPLDRQEAIFDPFDRGGETGPHGAGLGLPITRALVQVLGGELDLESVPGQGSCFRVRLMLAPVAGTGDAGTAAVRREKRITGYEGRRRRILVMDDDPAQLAFARRTLEDLGFDVATAPDGATALALCAVGTFDLALLDIAMPGPNGWATAQHLRATHGEALRIVMLSANAHERHGPEGVEAAHDRFLDKPVSIATLTDALGDLLGLHWVREGVGDAPDASGGETAPEAAGLPDAARAHVDALRKLLKLGHVRGIEAEIRRIEAAAPDSKVLVASLYDCLDRFDLPALGRLVEGL